jgi:hypothetical protein
MKIIFMLKIILRNISFVKLIIIRSKNQNWYPKSNVPCFWNNYTICLFQCWWNKHLPRLEIWGDSLNPMIVCSIYCWCALYGSLDKPCYNLLLVFRIENLLQCLYGYFGHNLKKHLEFTKLAQIMEIKSNKILCNIKIR